MKFNNRKAKVAKPKAKEKAVVDIVVPATNSNTNLVSEFQAYKAGLTESIKTLTDFIPTALQTVKELAQDADSDSVRLKAAQDILDRLNVKVTTPTNANGNGRTDQDIFGLMSDEELVALKQRFLERHTILATPPTDKQNDNNNDNINQDKE